METLAIRLKQARSARSMTAPQLTQAMAEFGEPVSASYIYQLESGVQDNPSLSVLRSIALSLGVSVGWLVGEDFLDSAAADRLQDRAAELNQTAARLRQEISSIRLGVADMVREAEHMSEIGKSLLSSADELPELGSALAPPAGRPTTDPAILLPLKSPQLPLTSRQRAVLAGRLYVLRRYAGLKVHQVQQVLPPHLDVESMEGGDTEISASVVAQLLDVYGVADERQRACVLDIASGKREPAWYDEPAVPLTLTAAYHLEQQASHVWMYTVQFMPTLLQTPDYARAASQAAVIPGTRADIIEAGMRFNLARQEVLQRSDPPIVWALVDESVFLRAIGTPEVRLQQLDALIERSKQEHIILQIVPLESEWVADDAFVPRTGPFTLWRFRDHRKPDVVGLHTFAWDELLDPASVDAYRVVFNFLATRATEPGPATLDVIQQHRRRLLRTLR
ncbi:Scr1 family TA system antitoxin-like transcriptional regulator (plasmid) [Nonomuraea sp. NBC_00507]|uniref:DUF5753 domain-containing protein n=1 Tax=Nonomuraea sp. NBC_00507 TaxID=2976002 RepID=UPI002E17E6CC